MKNPVNPFIVSGMLRRPYFCDREREESAMLNALLNGRNIVLISPRRMGKTSLINVVFDSEEIKDRYLTIFVDILQTSSLNEFVLLFGRAIYNSLVPSGRKMVMQFVEAVKSVCGSLGFDAFSGMPSFNLQIGNITRPELTLEEIFGYLKSSGRRCIVSIDEFQQISKYPEKNVEAMLRAHMQRTDNLNFIFAGSERHLLHEMFSGSARPFFGSCDIMELRPIDVDVYESFAKGMFESRDKRISSETVRYVYRVFDGNTYYMQRCMNGIFADTETGREADMDCAVRSVSEIMDSYATIYREILSNMPERQKQVLYAMATSPEDVQPLSAGFLADKALPSASSVQTALRKLSARDVIMKSGDRYVFSDPLFKIWLNSIYGDSSSGRF